MRSVAQLNVQFTREWCICWGQAKAVNLVTETKTWMLSGVFALNSPLSIYLSEPYKLPWRLYHYWAEEFALVFILSPILKNRQIRRWTGTAAHLEPQNPRNRVLQQVGCLDRGTRVRWAQVKDPAPVYGYTQMHTTRKFKKPNRSIGIGLLSDLHRSLSTLN